MNPEVICIQ